MKISDFVMSRANADYFLPSIQREFVWKRKEQKIEKLFDSFLQEYPVGNILVWELTKELKAEQINFDLGDSSYKFEAYDLIANYDEDEPHNKEANLNGRTQIHLILDGQQRLTSLLIGLKGSYTYSRYKKKIKTLLYINLFSTIEHSKDNIYGLKYDLKFFEKGKVQNDKDHLWIELGKVLDFQNKTAEDFKEAFESLITEAAGSDASKIKKAKNILGQVHKVICNAEEALWIKPYRTANPDTILNVFVRTNDGGVKLEKADLLLSYLEADKTIFEPNGARKEIIEFVDELNKEEFAKPSYKFEKDDVLKASLVLTDLDVRYKLKNFNKQNLATINENWKDIKKYLKLTVKLIAAYGFQDKDVVSKNSVIPIAYYLKQNKLQQPFLDSEETKEIDVRSQIIRWFTISTLTGVFGRSTDTALENIRAKLKEGKSLSQLENLELLNKEDIQELVDEAKYNSQYSHLILMLISDFKYRGDDLAQDHMYPSSKFNEAEFDKFGLSSEEREEFHRNMDSIGNIQLIRASINIRKTNDDYIDWNDQQNKEFLDAMLTPKLADYSFKNFLTFIKKREEMMTNKLMASLMAKSD